MGETSTAVKDKAPAMPTILPTLSAASLHDSQKEKTSAARNTLRFC